MNKCLHVYIDEAKNEDVQNTDCYARTCLHIVADYSCYFCHFGADKNVKYLLSTVIPHLNEQIKEPKYDCFNRSFLHYLYIPPDTDPLPPWMLEFQQYLQRFDIDHQDINGHTAIHLAIIGGHYTRQLALDRNSSIERSYTPSHAKCKFLLLFKPNLSLKDKHGMTAYHHATCDTRLFEMLVDYQRIDFIADELQLLKQLSKHHGTYTEIAQKLHLREQDSNDTSICPQLAKEILIEHTEESLKSLKEGIYSDHNFDAGQVTYHLLSKNALCCQNNEKQLGT